MAAAAEIHKQLADAWNARDFNRLENLLHPGYTYMGGDGKELVGPEQGMNIGRMFATAFSDGRLEVKRVFIQGDTAIAEMIGRGTHTGPFMGVAPTGKQAEVPICDVIELRDGKVYREHEYMDMLVIMTQLGVVTLPGRAAGA
jgi:steroid delta-isomerase-like uncharacterized protein